MSLTNQSYDDIPKVICKEIGILIRATELLAQVHNEISGPRGLSGGTIISKKTSKEIEKYFQEHIFD